MPDKNKLTRPEDHLLDKEEWVRLSIHDVTEESKKRLYQTIYLIGGYVVILVSIFTWFAYTNINDAVELLVGNPDHPTEFMQNILTESIEKRTEALQDNIMRRTDSTFEEYSMELGEQVDRLIDNKMKEMDLRLGEIIKDNQEELNRTIEYRLNQINR